MDLQQKINQMFQGHAEILSLSTQKSYWRKTQGAWLNSSFNEFQRSFTPTAQKEIEEIKKGLSRNDPHAYIITLDHNDSELWITTINCTFADVKYMRSGKSAIKPKILSANGIYLASDNILALNHRAGNLATYPGCYHITGGGANPEKDHAIIDVLLREGKEEAVILEDEIGESNILSLAIEPTTGFYQVNFLVSLKIASDELKKRKGDGEGKMVYVENKQHIFTAWLLENQERFVPSGLAQCLIYGAKTFGQSWTDEILDKLYGKRFAEAYAKSK